MNEPTHEETMEFLSDLKQAAVDVLCGALAVIAMVCAVFWAWF